MGGYDGSATLDQWNLWFPGDFRVPVNEMHLYKERKTYKTNSWQRPLDWQMNSEIMIYRIIIIYDMNKELKL